LDDGRNYAFIGHAMDLSIRTDIEKIGGDPDFVEFIMAWHGEIGATTSVPFAGEIQAEAYQKKIKRWTQRDFGTNWKFYWKVIWGECWNARRKIVLRRNLFKLEPRVTQAAHRPRNEGRWNAVFDLRNYFIKIDGRPHMRLVGLLFYPDQDEDTFIKEWERRKDWFKDENGAERLDQLEGFYAHNRVRILETLRTGIPFYAKWESRTASAHTSAYNPATESPF
jgi:hypothetical protein